MNSTSPVANTKHIVVIILAALLLALVLACTTASSPSEPNKPIPTSSSAARITEDRSPTKPSGSSETQPAGKDSDATTSSTTLEHSNEATVGGETGSTAADTASTRSDTGTRTGDTQEAAGSSATTDTSSASSGRRPAPGGDAGTEARVGPSAPASEAEVINAALPADTVGIVLTISRGHRP